jgi:excisionase family DNA binding protein
LYSNKRSITLPGTMERTHADSNGRPRAGLPARLVAPPSEPLHLRTYEVAEILHVSPKTVTRWAKDGKLPFSKTLGGHRRYPEDAIRALADELRVQPAAHPVA